MSSLRSILRAYTQDLPLIRVLFLFSCLRCLDITYKAIQFKFHYDQHLKDCYEKKPAGAKAPGRRKHIKKEN